MILEYIRRCNLVSAAIGRPAIRELVIKIISEQFSYKLVNINQRMLYGYMKMPDFTVGLISRLPRCSRHDGLVLLVHVYCFCVHRVVVWD